MTSPSSQDGSEPSPTDSLQSAPPAVSGISRRQFLGAGAAIVLATTGVDAIFLEPHDLEITRHVLSRPPAASRSTALRVAHLSDLHLQRLGDYERQVARAVNAARPQAIVITGDAIDRRSRLPVLAAFLDELDIQTPKYAILGNWEYQCRVDVRALSSVYAARNGQLLINESVVCHEGGHELRITGIDDALRGTPNLARALKNAEPSAVHLLLAHCPAYRDVLSETTGPDSEWLRRFGPQLMLAGHTHGGQINLGGFCPWRPVGSGPYVSGWYSDVWPHMYVSRGLGVVDLPVRFGAPPEVAIFEWPASTSPISHHGDGIQSSSRRGGGLPNDVISLTLDDVTAGNIA